jgi:hypothetical protein
MNMVNKQGETKMSNAINAIRVYSKARKQFGTEYPAQPTEWLVHIEKNKSITIYRERNGVIENGGTMKIGDTAEHDSYNLRYLGSIEAITEKSITIWPNGHRVSAEARASNAKKKVKRLDLSMFCLRNFKFDLEAVNKENHETSLYI